MRIFFACHRLPFPPKRGGKIRPFNIIRHLADAGHSVTVASIARSEEEAAEGEGLKEYCDELLVGRVGSAGPAAQMVGRLFSSGPSSMGYFYSRALHQRVMAARERKSFDFVFVHCSSAAQYARGLSGLPSILDFGDMDSHKWQAYSRHKPFPLSLGYRIEGAKLEREERRLADVFDACTCTTRQELETLDSYGADCATNWFPNGVDSDFFAPTDGQYSARKVTFVGRMDYFPNQQAVTFFCEAVLPLLKNRVPGVEFWIVGAEPPTEIRRLADIDAVSVTGTVPDVRDYVRDSALTVAPLSIARGTQNKILESMAMGVPVVSSEVAARGVDAVPGEHILTAGSAEEYADRIALLLTDAGRRRALAEASRDRVLTNHSWNASMERLDGIIDEVLRSRPDAGLSAA